MAGALTTQQRAELLVFDGDTQLPISPGSIQVISGGEFVSWSDLYGNGQLDVIGVAAGTATVRATLGGKVGELEITVTEAETGELVLTLGPARPK